MINIVSTLAIAPRKEIIRHHARECIKGSNTHLVRYKTQASPTVQAPAVLEVQGVTADTLEGFHKATPIISVAQCHHAHTNAPRATVAARDGTNKKGAPVAEDAGKRRACAAHSIHELDPARNTNALTGDSGSSALRRNPGAGLRLANLLVGGQKSRRSRSPTVRGWFVRKASRARPPRSRSNDSSAFSSPRF